jgi:hypothetical protein
MVAIPNVPRRDSRTQKGRDTMLQQTTGRRIAIATVPRAHLRLARPSLGRRLVALTSVAVLLGLAPALSAAAADPAGPAAAAAAGGPTGTVNGPQNNDTPWDREPR